MWNGFSRGNRGSVSRGREKRRCAGNTGAIHQMAMQDPGLGQLDNWSLHLTTTHSLLVALPVVAHTSKRCWTLPCLQPPCGLLPPPVP